MKFCSECGGKVIVQQARDRAPRFVCTACRAAYLQDPRLASGCIARRRGRILLCRRAVDPGIGRWEIPGGFVAPEESTANAAQRELLEEAGARIEVGRPYALLHLPHINQMRVIYLARLLDDSFTTGPETLELALFDESSVPWTELAFETTRSTLRRYFEDQRNRSYGFHFVEILPFAPGRR